METPRVPALDPAHLPPGTHVGDWLVVAREGEHGEWLHPSGTPYPFLVMDWIDGAPLYEQARRHHASSQQVLQWLAQLASALQALHAQGCVHRDLKGDNVLVRHSRLDTLILRMLSVRPEQRGSAAELGEALEQAAQLPHPESTRSLFAQEPRPSGSSSDSHGKCPSAVGVGSRARSIERSASHSSPSAGTCSKAPATCP